MAVLDVLGKHGELLFKLANSDAPDEAKKAVNSLDDAVLRLTSSLDKASYDKKFIDRAGAFATIAGDVTKLVLNAKIDEALKKAITLSENDVSAIIALLKKEMADFRDRQDSILALSCVLATNEYNHERKKIRLTKTS